MKRLFYFLLLITFIFCFGCKKEDPIDLSGQLLLSQKFPTPLSHKKIQFYQPGSPSAIGIASGASSASATALTDANGFFRLHFKPGKSMFIVFRGSNANPLIISNAPGDTTFPYFTRRNFTLSEQVAGKPIYIGKIIEEAIIKVRLQTAIDVTDTIGFEAYTTQGRIVKEYSGLQAPAQTLIQLDTLKNMLLTDFDYYDGRFLNNVHAGRKQILSSGRVTFYSTGFIMPARFSANDEAKNEIIFYFSK